MNRWLRISHAVVIGLLLASTLGLPAASAAPDPAPRPPPQCPGGLATINVTTFNDEWDIPTNPASASTKCSLREALQLLYLNGNRGCGPLKVARRNVTIQMPRAPTCSPTMTFCPTSAPIRPQHLWPERDYRWRSCGHPGRTGAATGIFKVVNGTLNLKDVTLQNGNLAGGGGAIHMVGGAFIAECCSRKPVVTAPAAAINGGAILDDSGDLTVTNSIFKTTSPPAAAGVSRTTAISSMISSITILAADARLLRSTPSTYPVIIDQSEFKGQYRTRVFNPADNSYTPNTDIYGGGAIATTAICRSIEPDPGQPHQGQQGRRRRG